MAIDPSASSRPSPALGTLMQSTGIAAAMTFQCDMANFQ